MERLPHCYRVDLSWQQQSAIIEAPPRPPIAGGPPPEFGGQGYWWSPEHLLLSSLGLCFLTTVDALAARRHVQILSCSSRVTGQLDKTAAGLAFTALSLHVDAKVNASDVDQARDLLEAAKKHCIIANTLKPSVTLVASVSADDAAPAGGEEVVSAQRL